MAGKASAYDQDFYERLIAVDPTGLSRTLSEHDVGAWLLDFGTDELRISQGLLEIIGYDKAPGRTRSEVLQAVYAPADIQKVREATERHINEGQPYRVETLLRHASGRYIRTLTRGRAIFGQNGKPTHMIGVLTSQEDLELAKSSLDWVERVSRIGTFRYDYASGRMHLSDGAHRLLGYEQGIVRYDLNAIVSHYHPEDRAMVRASIAKAEAGDGAFEFEVRLRTARGEERFVRASGQVEFGRDGEPVSRIGVVQDLTGDRARERELDAAKTNFVRSEEIAHLGHWRYDLATDDLFWSRGIFLIHGYEESAFKPERSFARSRYHPDDLPLVEQRVSQAMEDGHPFEYQVRILDRDDDIRHIKVQGEVERDASGNAVAYFGIAQDVTSEVAREQQMRQAQKMEAIGNLTGGMAHDFNNVLGVILGNLEIVLDDLPDNQMRPLVQSSIDAVLRGADLTKNMLSFARQAPIEAAVLDLNEIVEQSIKWIARTLPANIQLQTSLGDSLWKIDADRASTENAILNLIINSRDAMSDGGVLRIETENLGPKELAAFDPPVEAGHYVHLRISDTGTGIPSAEVERIFEPFFTTKEPGKGTGLGLSMVHGFMQQSDGAIRVESTLGRGTTFSLLFKAAPDQSTEWPSETENNVTKASGERILVAEDEPEIARLLVWMLEKAGHSVVSATSGDHALEIFQDDPSFNILLSDIVMPGRLQGPALCRRLREIKPDLAVVLMSGYANEALVHGNGLRAEDVRLMKPVRRAELFRALETCKVAGT